MIKPSILAYAFRYALGRSTYAAHEVADTLTQEWPDLTQALREFFKREIREALEKDRAGHDIDREMWSRILDLED